MSAIRIEDWLPAGSGNITVKGSLLRDYDLRTDLALLDQDILEVALPDGITIDVGWFPENSPNGRFVIRVFRKHRRNIERKPIEAKRPIEVANVIRELVKEYFTLPSRSIASCASGVSQQVVFGDAMSHITHFA
jgi:hypothetical protein